MLVILIIAMCLLMIIAWMPLAEAGVQFSDGIGYALLVGACLVFLLPIIISLLRGGKKK